MRIPAIPYTRSGVFGHLVGGRIAADVGVRLSPDDHLLEVRSRVFHLAGLERFGGSEGWRIDSPQSSMRWAFCSTRSMHGVGQGGVRPEPRASSRSAIGS